MSQQRRDRRQARIAAQVAHALHRHAWTYVYVRVQHACLWFLLSYRHYRIYDRMTTECDLAVLGVLRWARTMAPIRHLPKFVQAEIAW